MKKRKLKKKVIVIFVVAILLVIGIIAIILFKPSSPKEVSKAKVLDKIPEYGYSLEEDQPKIYKDLFKDLVKILEENPINEEEYAKTIAQMFAIDFYNLENKVSKNDVGGVSFVAKDYADNFVLEASDTVYKYVKQNLYGDRKQNLPEVTSSEATEVKTGYYNYDKIKDAKAYTVKVKLEYKEDLDYPTTVTVKLIHNDKKLEVCEMK